MIVDRGTRLGPYEILEPLGSGGMGEVYSARDTRLNRTVAIKVSKSQFTDRFEREARAVAALNHPNICALYDVGPDYLVMELVEGPTLAARIGAAAGRSGRIALEETLAIARQIADALEAAHEKGIVHRDLKPANIKITPDGTVKVLDFGLATAAQERTAGDAASSPTLTISAQNTGTLLGTAAYMAPEQARGTTVDKRADIWAFGVVLYEMLTGNPMFAGETVSDILAGVLRAEPDWNALPPDTPPALRSLLRRCLQRDRKRRLRDIGDARLELEDAPAAAAPARARSPLPWVLAALLAGALIGATWSRLRPAPQFPRAVSRWTVMPAPSSLSDVALSRDGTRMVYAGATAGAEPLMLSFLDRPDAKPLPGTAGAVGPIFSPDGQWIAYYEGEKLKKIPVSGGPPITVCEAVRQRGRTWGDDDSIVYGTVDGGLMRVSAAGGTPKALTTPDRKKGETSHQWPHFLPGAKALIFTISNGGSYDTAQIAVLDVERGSYRTLVNGGFSGHYVPTGHLVFARDGRLFAAPFDTKRLAVTGAEVPVIQDLSLVTLGTARYAISDSGLLVYLAATPLQERTIEWVDRNGNRQASSLPPRRYIDVRLSPDGRRFATSIANSNLGRLDIWIGELERGTLTRLTSEDWNFSPVWTPDGRHVTFGSRGGGAQLIKQIAADGSGKPELLLEGATQLTPVSWTPRGDLLLFLTRNSGTMQLSLLPASVGGRPADPRRMLETAPGEGHGDAQVSPDGQWFAYESNESGRFEVYVRPFPGPGAKSAVSTQGGDNPRWSASGRELFYRDPVRNRIMSVEVRTTPEFRAGQPRPLFALHSEGYGALAGISVGWDVTPDGQRFLVITSPEGQESGVRLQAVVNWFEELRRLVPPEGK
jgi:serine/threonine-protein kinase